MEVCTKDLVPCDKNVTVDIKYPKACIFFFTNDVNTRSFSQLLPYNAPQTRCYRGIF